MQESTADATCLKFPMSIRLPGIGGRFDWRAEDLLEKLVQGIHFASKALTRELLPRLPSWQRVEMAEVIQIAYSIEEHPEAKLNECGKCIIGAVHFFTPTQVFGLRDLIPLVSFALLRNAEMIVERVLPECRVPEDGKHLALSLALAEQVVSHLTTDRAGTRFSVASPTRLQQVACDWMADHWCAVLNSSDQEDDRVGIEYARLKILGRAKQAAPAGEAVGS